MDYDLLTYAKLCCFYASLNVFDRRPEIFNLTSIVVVQQLRTCDYLIQWDCLVVYVLVFFICNIFENSKRVMLVIFLLSSIRILLCCLFFICYRSLFVHRPFVLIFLLAFRSLPLNSERDTISPAILNDYWQLFPHFQISPLEFGFSCQAEVSVITDYQIDLAIFVEHGLWHYDLATFDHRFFRVLDVWNQLLNQFLKFKLRSFEIMQLANLFVDEPFSLVDLCLVYRASFHLKLGNLRSCWIPHVIFKFTIAKV